MDYFNELLQSYSKLKKRKLKLLQVNESDESKAKAQQLAAAAIQKAQSANASFSKAQGSGPFQLTKSDGLANASVLYVFPTKKGWKYSNALKADGGPTFMHSIDDGKYVGYFDNEGKVDTAASKKYEKTPAGQNIAGSELAAANPGEINPVIESFQEMQLIINDVYAGIDAKMIKGKNWGSPAAFGTYVFGMTKQALESQILNLKVQIDFDEATGTYITSIAPPNISNIKQVAKNLETIFKFLAKDNITEDEKGSVANIFAVNSDGSVSIFADTANSGLVFKDENGFLKMLAGAMSKKFEIKIRKVNIKKHVSLAIDNAIRGVAMEEILPLLALQRQLIVGQATNHPGVKVMEKGVQVIMKQMKEKLFQMQQSYQAWVKNFDESALEHDEKAIIDSFTAILGPTGSNLVASIVKASKDAISVRQADFIVTRGRETGGGRRQDTFEVFADFNKCKTGLLRMGYTDEEITTKGLIKTVPVEDAFSTREDLYGIATKSGLFKKGQQVFYTPVSFKNYMDLNEAVFGTTSVGSNFDFINGISADPENLFLRKAREVIGFTPQEHEAVKQYNEELHAIGGKIRDLDNKVKARSGATGKIVGSSPFRGFVESTLDIMKANSTFDELHNPESKEKTKLELCALLQRYQDSVDDDEELELKIKQYVTTFVKNKKVIADIASGDKKSKQYLAMKLFNSGGSVDDGLTCDYRGLGSGENYNFLQNDVIKSVMSSWMNDTGEWVFHAVGNNFVWQNTRDRNQKVTMQDKVESRQVNGVIQYSTKTTCLVNRHVLKAFNKKKAANASMFDIFLQSQKAFLNELVSIKEEAVGKS